MHTGIARFTIFFLPVAQALDVILTYTLLGLKVGVEANPIMQTLLSSVLLVLILKVGVGALCAYGLYYVLFRREGLWIHKYYVPVCGTLIGLAYWPILNNLAVLFLGLLAA